MIALNLLKDEKWKKCHGFSPVITLFKSFHHLNEEIEILINEQTFPISLKKNKHIISPIDNNHFLYLITKGVVRSFVREGKIEITTWIASENAIIGTIKNLWLDHDSEEYLQTLEDCELIAIPHSLSQYLYENFNLANIVGRKIMELYYRSAEERAYLCRITSAEKRYLRFLTTYPGLINRVSLKYIASFLAMRLETLSRIRARI